MPVRPIRTPAWMDRHFGLILIGLVAFVAAVAVVSFQVFPAQAAATVTAPYTDAQATGYLTLYDKAGKAIKSGSVKDKPFVWKAVSSAAAKAPYNATGHKGTLFAYQPRKGVAPGGWSGDSLTASTAYSDVKHPAAQATAQDFSLQDFLSEFPAQWDGTIELRLYLSAPGVQAQSTGYASTDLKITGDTWVVVGGGPGAGAGGVNIPGKVSGTAGASPAPSGSGSAGASAGAVPSSSAGAAGADGSGAAADAAVVVELPYLRTPGYLFVSAAVIVAVVFAGVLMRRRRQFATGEW